MGQKEVGGMKVPVVVLEPTYGELKKVSNCKSTAKGLRQTEAFKASEPAFFEREVEFSQASWHSRAPNPEPRTSGKLVVGPLTVLI
jgi:hypothetical protein